MSYFKYMSRSITNQINRVKPFLSKSESQVCNWILSNPSLAINSPIAKIASAAGVSQPTVIRFCRSLDLAGYRELRHHLIADQHRHASFLHQNITLKDSAPDAALKVLESSIHSLVELRSYISKMPFEAAVNIMKASKQFIFAGLGASSHVAADASHKFFRLGIPCSTALDSQTILQKTAIAMPGDTFITISYNGNWPELISGMMNAKVNGACVITLTDPRSPLSKVASELFPCHCNEDLDIFTPMSSRIAQLTILDSLQVALALSMGDIAEKNLRKVKAALYDQTVPAKQKKLK